MTRSEEAFQEVSIKDLMVEFHDGPHATPKPSQTGPVFLGIKNITEDGRLDLSAIRHIDEREYPRWTRRVTPEPNDIVFTYEATLHRYALVPQNFRGCLGRRLALIRPRQDIVDPRFLHMALRGPEWRRTVEDRVIAGATVDRVPLIDFPNFPIMIPSLEEQRRIAATLGAFDELITINERRIELLEDLAKSLYREWFVLFKCRRRTDAEFEDTDIGRIPSGWEVRALADIAEVVVDGASPRGMESHRPYVGLEHFPRRSTTLREWGHLETVTSRKLLFACGDTLFGKIRPYFHKVVWAPFAGAISSDAIVFRARANRALPALVNAVVSSDALVAEAVATSNGTKMPRANSDVLLSFPLALPRLNDVVLDEFELIVGHTLKLAANLVKQSRSLAATRDLLLPRLVTGRLDISEIDLRDLLPAEAA
jgi:type I restriction enzyme, S subunit